MYAKIHEYATALAKGSREYHVQPMQTFMAAWCATTQYRHGICLAAPAEGKTYAFLHFLNKMITADEDHGTEAVIYCPQEVVANQARVKLRMFDCWDKVTVSAVWEPKEWRKNEKNKIFIVDEGEEAIERRLLDLTPTGFTGLAALRDKRVFLFTATLTDYYKACWMSAFDMPEEAVRRFPSTM